MFSILEICAFILYIYFKTIVIDNLHLFKKWRDHEKQYICFEPATLLKIPTQELTRGNLLFEK